MLKKKQLALAVGVVIGNLPASLVIASDASGSGPTSGRPPAVVPSSNAGDSIEEVIVTARRREENLQAVPISVTVISGEVLTVKGINNALDLARTVPSLNVMGLASPKAFSVGLRGLRSGSFVLQDDPTVGTYFAEGVIGHPYGFGDTMFDIQSVQVLKGPQGTLFGRNTTGGAILVEPNKASIDDGFGGNVKVAIGNYNAQKFQGTVNVPLNDVAVLRVAGVIDKRDGYTTNVLTGQKFDEVNNQALRVSLLLRPTKDVRSHTVVDYLDEDSAPTSLEIVKLFPGAALLGGAANTQRLLADQVARGVRNFASWQGTNGPTDLFSPTRCAAGLTTLCRDSSLPKEKLKNWGFLNNTQVDFDGFSVKNIISYRDMTHAGMTDNVPATDPLGAPVIGLQSGIKNHIAQWNDEFQVLGKAFENRLDWQTGVFVMHEWGREAGPNYFSSPSWAITQGTGTNKSSGAFLQGTYKLTEKLKGTLGVRKNFDTREINDFAVSASGTACQVRNPATAYTTFLPLSQCSLKASKSWSAHTWTASLDYQVTDDSMIYVASRRGYHSGGFNLRAHRADTVSYNPEFVRDWEIGTKSDWELFGRPIRTNLAIYNTDFTDEQVAITTPTSHSRDLRRTSASQRSTAMSLRQPSNLRAASSCPASFPTPTPSIWNTRMPTGTT